MWCQCVGEVGGTLLGGLGDQVVNLCIIRKSGSESVAVSLCSESLAAETDDANICSTCLPLFFVAPPFAAREDL